jgi:hypothetical protein
LEARRIDLRLGALETELSLRRIGGDLGWLDDRSKVEAEVALLRRRLLVLLEPAARG